MRLTRIEATDFAQWATLDLDLSTHSAIAVVGANGSGKSRLLDAVLWSLFGRAARGTSIDRLVRWGRKQAKVRTTWDLGGLEVAVVRTRSLETKAGESSLDLYVDGERRTRHTIAETEAAIADLTHVTVDMVRAGPMMVQHESDELLAARPADRFEILAGYFGLDDYAVWAEEAKSRHSQLALGAIMVRAELSEYEETIAAAIEEDWVGAADASQEALERCIADVDARSEDVTRLREGAAVLRTQQERLGILDGELADARVSVDRTLSRRSKAEGELAAIMGRLAVVLHEPSLLPVSDPVPKGMLEDARAAVKVAAAAEMHRAEANGQLTALKTAAALAAGQNLCDHCPYAVNVGDVDLFSRIIVEQSENLEAIGDAEGYLRQLTDEDRDRSVAAAAAVRKNNEAIRAYEQRKVARDNDGERLERLEAEHGELTAAVEQENERIARLNGEALRIRQQTGQMAEAALVLGAASIELNALKADLLRRQADQVVAEARLKHLDAADAARTDAAAMVRHLEKEVAAHAVVAKMFHRDEIPTRVLARGVPLVEAAANEVLGRMPGSLRIELRLERALKGGGTKAELGVVVDQAGQVLEYADLGGGERFRIDFALRIGIGQVRSTLWETLWLDEPFSAQDEGALAALHECLTAVSGQFGLMVVVTHSQETADVFPARLQVSKHDRVATAEVQG